MAGQQGQRISVLKCPLHPQPPSDLTRPRMRGHTEAYTSSPRCGHDPCDSSQFYIYLHFALIEVKAWYLSWSLPAISLGAEAATKGRESVNPHFWQICTVASAALRHASCCASLHRFWGPCSTQHLPTTQAGVESCPEFPPRFSQHLEVSTFGGQNTDVMARAETLSGSAANFIPNTSPCKTSRINGFSRKEWTQPTNYIIE